MTSAQQRMARKPKPVEKQGPPGAQAQALAALQFNQKTRLVLQQLLGADIFEVGPWELAISPRGGVKVLQPNHRDPTRLTRAKMLQI